jgi:protocatechuate 3,4-dioxygenase beta subunit
VKPDANVAPNACVPSAVLSSQVSMSRRSHLKVLGLLPFGAFLARPRALQAAEVACTIAPQMTEGPYWVDERLNRADLTTNTTRTSVLNAVPLTLDILLQDQSGQSCGINAGANVQVDIWHCDAAGAYSDASGAGQASTLGQTFLRGYQVSDAAGLVSFKTIYPGWYTGRATHLHLRARVYDASGNTTYNFASQLFFDDSFTDQVYTRSPYNVRGARDTRNSNDGFYADAGGRAPLLTLANRSDGSVTAAIAIGLGGLPANSAYRQFGLSARNEGSATVPTLVADLGVASSDVGRTGEIYVAADVHGDWYFNNGSGWVYVADPLKGFPAFYRGALAASHRLDIVSGRDTSRLGRVNVYAGYGFDNADMLQNQRYKFVYALN